MEQDPQVSVIVAAYNAQDYLGRCLDSLLAQTFTDFEVIVVDDGSTDRTSAIADEYARADARIRVIHKPNGGVASARQAGLDAARGEYMIHADSDDWVDAGMLEEMVEVAHNRKADMVISDFYFIYPGNVVEYRSQQPKSLEPLVVLGEMMFNLHGSLCNKLIRRRLLYEYKISFIEGMNVTEDQYMVLRLLAHDISVAYIPKAYYHYDHTRNEDSICNAGMLASDRLRPLEMISSYTDISPVQDYFDKAVFHIAFEYLYEPKELCPNYRGVFRKHWRSISRAKGLPLRAKAMILLKINRIDLPFGAMKKGWSHILGRDR